MSTLVISVLSDELFLLFILFYCLINQKTTDDFIHSTEDFIHSTEDCIHSAEEFIHSTETALLLLLLLFVHNNTLSVMNHGKDSDCVRFKQCVILRAC